MYSVLSTLSKYFYTSKNITSYTFLLVLKIVESLQCILNNKNNMKTGSSMNVRSPPNHSLLINQFNNLSSDSINKNPENKSDIDDIQTVFLYSI